MADFGSVINAYLEGRQVNFRPLVLFDFRDGEVALWSGEYPLISGGKTWRGLGQLVNIDGIDAAASLQSSVLSFTLTGVDREGADTSWVGLAASADRANYVDRIVTVYGQFFDEDWQPMEDPIALKAGIMANVTISRTRIRSGRGAAFLRSVTLRANNIFYGRSIPSASFYTDADQQRRFAGDKFLAFVTSIQTAQIPVPWR